MRLCHVLCLLPIVLADMAMPDMDPEPDLVATSEVAQSSLVPVPHKVTHHHGAPILETHLAPEERLYWENYSTETYFNTPSKHRGALLSHIALYLVAYVGVYPFVLVFWNIQHCLYLPALSVHTILVLVSVFNYWIFMGSIKELYPHNAFNTMTWLLFFSSIVHWVCALLAVAYGYLNLDEFEYFAVDHEDDNSSCSSPGETLRASGSSSGSFELDTLGESDGHLQTSNGSMFALPSRKSQFLLKFPAFKRATQVFGNSAYTFTGLANWGLFAYFLVYFPTGIATYCVYGTDGTMFNLLAHFIKGGVFFFCGLVTLARYCGAFKSKGWAWNHKFVTSKQAFSGWLKWQSLGLWTMEFMESSLILFYGSTNIFMEHLATPGEAWTAKDLQHVSIAFIFLGCGLCGVLVESKLSSWRFRKALDNLALTGEAKTAAAVAKATPGFSPNPFPLMTIYWTGILMSKHEQASALSTAIHTQWGNLLVAACWFRLMSYILSMLTAVSAQNLTKPLSPMTELVVSFCLMCGGLIFMESTDPVIHSFEYYGYTSMFTLNVSLGLVTLIMAWEMSVFAIKDWLLRREAGSRSRV